MQQHIIQQDTGLTPAQQGERAALVHLWALRIQNLMHVSNCAARWAYVCCASTRR